MSHKVQTVVKLLALKCAWTDIYGAQTDIYGTQRDIYGTRRDIYGARMDTYDLMSDKYITPLAKTREQSLYFKSEILKNTLRVLKKYENIHKNHRHIDLSLP